MQNAEYGPWGDLLCMACIGPVCSLLYAWKIAVFFLFLMHRKYGASNLIFRLELCIPFCSHPGGALLVHVVQETFVGENKDLSALHKTASLF